VSVGIGVWFCEDGVILSDSTALLPWGEGAQRADEGFHNSQFSTTLTHMTERKKTAFAKHLRRNQTSAENLAWEELRGRRCGGYKFRRQVPIDKYVVDFCA